MPAREGQGNDLEQGMVNRAAAGKARVAADLSLRPGQPSGRMLPARGANFPTSLVPSKADAAASTLAVIPGVADAWMGPLNPIVPTAPMDARARALDMMVGWNVTTNTQRLGQMDVRTLRNLARNCDLVNMAIDTRKDQMEAGRFDFKLIDDKLGFKSGSDPRIKELRDFFRFPDKRRPLARWMRKLADDVLTVDAPCIYVRYTRAGKPYEMRVIDTATIKPLIDADGETPLPPAPAYQQWLKGVPASDYAASNGTPDAVMTLDDILWHPRNPRPDTIFGWSAVEQITLTVNQAIRRQLMILAGYTEGTVPEALAPTPEGWNTDMIGRFQIYWNELLAGKFGEQRGIRFVPAGMEKAIFTKRWEDHAEFDEWLARVVFKAFRLPNTWAVKTNNRAVAGQEADTSNDEGRTPFLNYFCELGTMLVWKCFKYTDIEMVFRDGTTDDELSGAQAMNERLKYGGTTLNEERGARGADPYPNPAADTPFILTATGPVAIGAPEPADQAAVADSAAHAAGKPTAKEAAATVPEDKATKLDDEAVEKIADALLQKLAKKKRPI